MTTITRRTWPDDRKQITLWVYADKLDPVDNLANKRRISRAELIRQLLDAAVAAEAKAEAVDRSA